MLLIYSLGHGQTPSCQSFRENWVLPHLAPLQKPPTVESYSSVSLSQFLRALFEAFYLGCYFLSLGQVGIFTEVFPVSLSQLWVWSQYHYKSSSPIVYSHQEHGSWTSTWFLIIALATDTNMVPSGSLDHGSHINIYRASVSRTDCGLPHGLQQQLCPWTSIWPPGSWRIMDTHMVLYSSSDHGYQCSPQRQHDPLTSTRLQVAAQTLDIYLTFDGNRVMDISRVSAAVET